MATRKLVAHDSHEDHQILATDNIKRYIMNDSEDWQFLLGPSSSFTSSAQIIKLAGEFDTNDFNHIRVVGYLYNTYSGTIDNSASCTFRIYKVANPGSPPWDDQLLHTVAGTQIPNSYYYVSIDLSSLASASLDGDTTLMIEGTIVRMGRTYRDRIYVNHLGVYDSVTRLRNDVQWLNLSKKDE